MRNFIPVFKKEFKAYFTSPIAYVLIAMFLLISGYFFYNIYSFFNYVVFSMGMQRSPMMEQVNVTEMVCPPLYSNIVIVILLMVPLLTMRLLAEEKKLGTIEILLTYPIRDAEVVFGKFAACLAVYCVMLAATFLYPLMLFVYSGVEWGPVLSCYLGLLLVGSAFISTGLLISSLTENQIIAGVSTFGVLLLFWLVGASERLVSPELGAILKHLSLLEHFEQFAKGIIDTRDIIYYLNFTFFALFLTLRSLDSGKWRG